MRLSRRRPEAEPDQEFTPQSRAEGELPSLAVITMARDEGSMIRRWVDYYAGQVGAEHLVVIDDNSADGSTDDLACPVLRIPYLRKQGFEPARMGLLAGISAGLLEAYDAVMFCDADEFVVPEPRTHESLRHFVAARPGREAVGVLGLNVVHDVQREDGAAGRRADPRPAPAREVPSADVQAQPEVAARRVGARLARHRVPLRGRPRAVHVPHEVRRPRPPRRGGGPPPSPQHHRGPGEEDQLGAVGRRDGRTARRDHHRPRPRPDRAVRGEGARPEEDRPAPRCTCGGPPAMGR